MKRIFVLTLMAFTFTVCFAQDAKEDIKNTCLNYIEGFYDGDTTKLVKALKPSLYKFGFWKDEKTGKYGAPIHMTYQQAMNYANRIKAKKDFAKPDAPKKVEILDVQNSIAAAKITAWWGIDYVLLSRQSGSWMIEQVIWEGPVTPQ